MVPLELRGDERGAGGQVVLRRMQEEDVGLSFFDRTKEKLLREAECKARQEETISLGLI